MELKDYIGIVKRRILWILGTVALIMLVYSFMVITEREEFRSTAKILLKLRMVASEYAIIREVVIKPLLLTIETREAIIQSKPVYDRAAIILAAYRAGAASSTGNSSRLLTYEDALRFFQTHPMPDERSLSAMSAELQASVEFSRPGERIFIIDVTAISSSATDAIHKANAVAHAADSFTMESAREDFVKILREKEAEISENIKRQEVVKGMLQDIQKIPLDARGYEHVVEGIIERLDKLDIEEAEVRAREDEIDEEMRRILSSREYHRSVHLGLISDTETFVSADVHSLEDAILQQKHRIEVLERHCGEEHPDLIDARAQLKSLEVRLQAAIQRSYLSRRNELLSQKRAVRQKLLNIDESRKELYESLEKYRKFGEKYVPVREEYERLRKEHNDLLEAARNIRNLMAMETGYASVFEPSTTAVPIPKRAGRSLPLVIIVALILGVGLAYMVEYVDPTIRTEHDVRRCANIPVLAIVPQVREEFLLMRQSMTSPLAEIFSTASTLIHNMAAEAGVRSILIASSIPQEGKTSIAVNLGIAAARKGHKIALVDADMRKPQLHRLFGLDNSRGLSSLLQEESAERGSDQAGEVSRIAWMELRPTDIPDLMVLPSGPIPQNPMRTLSGKSVRNVVSMLSAKADLVLFDSPPICVVGDALAMSAVVDAVLIVIASGLVDRRQLTWAKHLLGKVPSCKLMGAILNRSRLRTSTEYYYYYSYKYKYRE